MKKITIICSLLISFLSCKNNKESFSWNFDAKTKYAYSFSQTSRSETKMNKDEKSNNNFITGTGKLLINGKSESLADLSFEGIKVKVKNDLSNDTIYETQPNTLIQDFQSNGRFVMTSNANDFVRVLMPLPNKNLSVGDICKIPLTIPFNVNGSLISSKGYNTLTFLKYEVIDGHTCAILNGDIQVSQLDLPEDFEGNYQLSEIGNATYYFDIENGYYIKSKVTFNLISLADNDDFYMSSKSSNTYTIDFNEIVDEALVNRKSKTGILNTSKNTPADVAKTVISFLQKRDTAKYLNIAIPLEKQKKLFLENIKYNPQENDTMAIYRDLKRKYDSRTENFLVRAGYILDIMKRDKNFDIEKATIDSIYYKHEKTKNYGGFSRTIIGNWADLTVEMTYNNEPYYFEIPQIIKVDNQWYLYYPEYYLRDERERQFVKDRVEQLKIQSEDFWK